MERLDLGRLKAGMVRQETCFKGTNGVQDQTDNLPDVEQGVCDTSQ